MIAWLIGMSGAGKTTLGRAVFDRLKPSYPNLMLLDGDVLRDVWQDQLGHTVEARRKNSDRIRGLCRLLDSQGIHAICCVLSIFPEDRRANRAEFTRYFEAYVKVDLDELVRRDSKGLYRAASEGRVQNVVGVDIDFPEPDASDLVLSNTTASDLDPAVDALCRAIEPLLGFR